jgi:tetratricopeptide (TPR) repeat protein
MSIAEYLPGRVRSWYRAHLFRRGDVNRSLELLQKEIGRNPSNLSLYYELGGILSSEGLIRDAIATYKKIGEIGSDDDRKAIQWRLGRLHLLVEEPDQALPYLLQSAAIWPGNAFVQALLGGAYLGLRNLTEAESHLSRALELDPLDPDANNWMVDFIEKSGRPIQEVEEFVKAYHDGNPDFPLAKEMLAAHYLFRMADPYGSLPLYEESLRLTANRDQRMEHYRYHITARDFSVRVAWDYHVALMELGMHGAVRDLAREFFGPKTEKMVESQVAEADGDLETALSLAQECTATMPTPAFLTWLGYLHLLRREWSKASDAFQYAVRIGTEKSHVPVQTYSGLSFSLLLAGKMDESEELCIKIEKRDEVEGRLFFLRAANELELWKLVGETSQELLERWQYATLARYYLARALAAQNELDRARSEYSRILEEQPKNSRAWYELGELIERMYDSGHARDAYARAVETHNLPPNLEREAERKLSMPQPEAE